tara:strand:+ start:236 stop:514 length:279 start_codon:yes stop_codon:yes gene_type:complete
MSAGSKNEGSATLLNTATFPFSPLDFSTVVLDPLQADNVIQSATPQTIDIIDFTTGYSFLQLQELKRVTPFAKVRKHQSRLSKSIFLGLAFN